MLLGSAFARLVINCYLGPLFLGRALPVRPTPQMLPNTWRKATSLPARRAPWPSLAPCGSSRVQRRVIGQAVGSLPRPSTEPGARRGAVAGRVLRRLHIGHYVWRPASGLGRAWEGLGRALPNDASLACLLAACIVVNFSRQVFVMVSRVFELMLGFSCLPSRHPPDLFLTRA